MPEREVRMRSRMSLAAGYLLATVAVSLVSGCFTAQKAPCSSEGPAAAPAQPPLKVAVYADAGPSGIGAVEWFRLVNESPEMELHLVDGAGVRRGALDGIDLLVMPGGNSKTEFTTLGTNGVLKLKEFLRNGGGYIGTCAGCCLLMDGEDRRARMMPWDRSGTENVTLFPTLDVNEKGAAALGIKKGGHVVRFHGGPFMWPTTNVIADAKMEVWATMDAEGTMKGRVDPKKRMYGAAAMIGGTYGKGRVFVISAHPEYFNSTLYIVRGAFKYVTGRDVTFPARPRSRRAISVGFVSGGISGIDTAETAIALASEKDFDLVLIDVDGVKQRRLDHIDVLVLTSDKLAKNDAFKSALAEFVGRGGKVVGFKSGVSMLPPGGVVCGTRKDAVKTIRSLFED